MALKILCLGDIVGRPGRQVVHQKLPALIRQRQIDLVVANAENIAGGSGITQNLLGKIRSYGVDVVTLGDHVFKRVDIVPTLQNSERIVRPANLSRHAADRRFTVVKTNSGVNVAVFSMLGRIYMNPAVGRSLRTRPSGCWVRCRRGLTVVVLDMHAEATSEKVAMGHFLDGKVSRGFRNPYAYTDRRRAGAVAWNGVHHRCGHVRAVRLDPW